MTHTLLVCVLTLHFQYALMFSELGHTSCSAMASTALECTLRGTRALTRVKGGFPPPPQWVAAVWLAD